MAAAGLAASAVGGQVAAKQSEGIIRSIMDALEKDIVHFSWEKEPNSKKMVLQKVDVHVTTGIVLGSVALALAWEAASWFASNFGAGNPVNVVDLLNPTAFVEYNIVKSSPLGALASWLTGQAQGASAAASASGQSIKVPQTFGAAYNLMMRDFTVALPGTAAQGLRNLVGGITLPKT
jgi:hypothetical protein